MADGGLDWERSLHLRRLRRIEEAVTGYIESRNKWVDVLAALEES